jgi:predicted nucleic acid-binding protein
MTAIIADTGPVVALLDHSDLQRDWALRCFRSFRPPLLICEGVLSEAWHLLRRMPSSRATLASWIDQGVLRLAFDFSEQQAETLALLEKYRDTPMDFADACLVRMSETQRKCKVWTIDSDFKFYRRNNRQMVPVLAPWS